MGQPAPLMQGKRGLDDGRRERSVDRLGHCQGGGAIKVQSLHSPIKAMR